MSATDCTGVVATCASKFQLGDTTAPVAVSYLATTVPHAHTTYWLLIPPGLKRVGVTVSSTLAGLLAGAAALLLAVPASVLAEVSRTVCVCAWTMSIGGTCAPHQCATGGIQRVEVTVVAAEHHYPTSVVRIGPCTASPAGRQRATCLLLRTWF